MFSLSFFNLFEKIFFKLNENSDVLSKFSFEVSKTLRQKTYLFDTIFR